MARCDPGHVTTTPRRTLLPAALVAAAVLAMGCGSQHGALSKAVIQSTFRSHRAELDACVTQRRSERTDLGEGGVVLVVMIRSDGRVGGASVQRSTFRDPPLEACLVRAARAIRFPAPERGIVVVHYPLHWAR